MGLIRKMTSVSTLGGVKYTSKREAQTKMALEEAKLLKAQRKAQPAAGSRQWDQVLAAIEAGEASWDDLSRLQKLSMPIGYQLRCKAASRRQRDV
jgi:hypothetical protein